MAVIGWAAFLSGCSYPLPDRVQILANTVTGPTANGFRVTAGLRLRLRFAYRVAVVRRGACRVRLPRGAAICPAGPGMGREAASV